MADLDNVTVTGTQDSTDYLTPIVTKTFAGMGQDTTTPAVQAQIASAVSRLRDINPDDNDQAIAANIKNNLPATISAITQTKPIDSGVDEVQQLHDYNTQRSADAQRASNLVATSPSVWGKAPSIDPVAYNKGLVDQSMIPSNALGDEIKQNNQFYTNQTQKGIANKTAEDAAQAQIKTVGDRQNQTLQQSYLDPNGDPAIALRAALTPQLAAMGVSTPALAHMASFNVPQLKLFAESFGTTAKEKADIGSTLATTLSTRATAAKTSAETAGVKSDNVVKAFKANSIGQPGGMPEAIAEEVMPAGKNANRVDNTRAAAVMNAASPDVANVQQSALTLLQEMNQPGANTGLILSKFKALNSNIQSINKNLYSIQAGTQGAGGGTAAQANAIAGANPDASYNPSVIRQYLLSTLGSISRQNLVRDKTLDAVKNGTAGDFERGKYATSLVPLAVVNPGGQVVSVDAYEPGEVQGAMNALRRKYPGAVVAPVSSVPLNQLGR